MAETQSIGPQTATKTPVTPNGQQHQKRGPNPHQVYKYSVPIRTVPLPSFYPNNPVSIFHVAYAWLSQALSPPPAEPSVVHEGTWDEATGSVHVRDQKAIRALWEQGFYGKGSLSRSEPNWLKREQARLGIEGDNVSELITAKRREERQWAKWERARLEQEIIRQTREAEAVKAQYCQITPTGSDPQNQIFLAPVNPVALLALPNSAADVLSVSQEPELNPEDGLHHDAAGPTSNAVANGHVDAIEYGTRVIPGLHKLKEARESKSVRFSPTVESTTFEVSDPPSPGHNGDTGYGKTSTNGILANAQPIPDSEVALVDKEHLQLMPEEALWLSFGLGVLCVKDPSSGCKFSMPELLKLFRQHCYFPPRNGPDDPDLQPDDPFLVHYAVYHHFRSIGWVPRGGIKFGVDWMLYTRGPVFDHAEFGLVVLPSYSHPAWQALGKKSPEKSWYWLHSILRVLSHVLKSMVLIYVDVPPPSVFDAAMEKGFAEALQLYKVREVMVKRWSSNRNR